MNEKLHNFQSSVWGAPFKPIPPDRKKKVLNLKLVDNVVARKPNIGSHFQ